MSSSSSDSDSDDFEPIRKIKINIRPKGDIVRGKGVADVSEIKASVEAWRPLGPPTHPSLSRRQSSLSSVSSMSFGASGSGSGLSVGPTTITTTTTTIGNLSGVQNSNHNNATTIRNLGTGGAGNLANSTIRSSPSCSSLVNEFNNRSSFSNFMSANTSRTSSPLTLTPFGDSSVPIAIAIQESIELIVKGHYDPKAIEPKFQTRSLGNIKIAFPNAFAKGSYGKLNPVLKLRLHSTENIIKYYASRLIKDLELGTAKNINDQSTDAFFHNNNKSNINNSNTNSGSSSGNNHRQQMVGATNYDSINTEFKISNDGAKLPTNVVDERSQFSQNSFDDFGTTTYDNNSSRNSKVIEFDIDTLMCHLKKMYDQSPTAKYYNVDVLRYQILPIQSIVESPLQVCAYWKIESQMVKLRIDFKHSNKSGFNLERLRELSFCVDFASFIPSETDVNSLSPHTLSNIRLNDNNNSGGALDMNSSTMATAQGHNTMRSQLIPSQVNDGSLGRQSTKSNSSSEFQVKLTPPPITARRSLSNNRSNQSQELGRAQYTELSAHDQQSQHQWSTGSSTRDLLEGQSHPHNATPSISNNQPKIPPSYNRMPPYITYEPQAHWNHSIKQLMWKFDTLLPYHKTDGLGSLFAKLDFRNHHGMPPKFLENCSPTPVEVKFLVTDSTLSKINMSIDSIGYKMSLLKREIRSGRYKSEPYVL